MSIWGHDIVHIEKDLDAQEWRVFTPRPPHKLLVRIPWADAFKNFTEQQRKQYSDYIEAIYTCLSHDTTALTAQEAEKILKALGKTAGSDGAGAPGTGTSDNKVVSLADYRRRKRGGR